MKDTTELDRTDEECLPTMSPMRHWKLRRALTKAERRRGLTALTFGGAGRCKASGLYVSALLRLYGP